jgi:tetratricopeptide (TPR) repeat protein
MAPSAMRFRTCVPFVARVAGAAIAAAALLSGVPTARAQSDEQLGDEEARALFEAGRTAYTAGRYEDALQHFQGAYRLSQRPALLFNIASSAERVRNDELAVESYRRYLELLPNAENRALVERRIEFLEGHGDGVGGEEGGGDGAPAASGGGGGPSVVGIALTAVGGALIIGGAISGGIALADAGTLSSRCDADGVCPDDPSVREAASRREAAAIASDVLLFGGLAVAAVGVVLMLVLGDAPAESPRAAVACDPNGCMAAVGGAF